jgi:hypothetical protein
MGSLAHSPDLRLKRRRLGPFRLDLPPGSEANPMAQLETLETRWDVGRPTQIPEGSWQRYRDNPRVRVYSSCHCGYITSAFPGFDLEVLDIQHTIHHDRLQNCCPQGPQPG